MVDDDEDEMDLEAEEPEDEFEPEGEMHEDYGAEPSAADGHGKDEQGEGPDRAAVEDSSFKGQAKTGPISEADGDEDEDDDELDLEEILREIEDEEHEDDADAENTQLKAELKEYRTAVKFLRSKLNEVNLLNAKLLYTNKVFKNYNLNGRQKLRVVENFDRASTVREAKLVYATLAEAFSGKPVTRKRRITEGLASRVQRSTKPRNEVRVESDGPTVLREGADLAARMKKLAGIKS